MTDICNTINNALIKGIHLNSIDVLLVRSIIQTIVLGVIIKWQGLVFLPMDKRKDWWKSLFALISAGISGTAVVLLCYLSVTLIPMGDAMALVFSSPLITLFIEWCASRFSLGKKWAIQFFSAFVLLAGVFFVIQPPFMNLNKNEKVSTCLVWKFSMNYVSKSQKTKNSWNVYIQWKSGSFNLTIFFCRYLFHGKPAEFSSRGANMSTSILYHFSRW